MKFTHVMQDGTKVKVTNIGKARVSYTTEYGTTAQAGFYWFTQNSTRIENKAEEERKLLAKTAFALTLAILDNDKLGRELIQYASTPYSYKGTNNMTMSELRDHVKQLESNYHIVQAAKGG